jgi:peroxiredoxin
MKQMKNFLAILMLVAVASCGGSENKATEQQQQTTEVQAEQPENKVTVYENNYLVKVGDIAPDFTLSLTDGSKFTLSENRGKVVMLQFTASWCGVCRKEMPFIERDIWLPNKDNKDFVLLGIDREEALEDVLKFVETTKVTYPIALDTNADVFASYAERKAGITRNILIDRDGRIVKLTRLFNETEFNELVQQINELLK